jgi:hypothetical protein
MGDCVSLPNYSDFIRTNLQSFFQLLVLPFISITQQDIDEYEDEPETYIKNDLEESESDTRRKHCMKLLQQMSRKFSSEMQ